ncbi:MAG: prepilin-type N-terminal cleavage/methylation domain-containing protein [Candidatus Aminicenantes bacterium]|nr:MAG: prepilin-type N-terminal cleavage/methylation domain-containing protein [Candidatus Aminicenantes bacterium]
MRDKKSGIPLVKKRGFSLTETLISLSIFALIAVAVSTSFLNKAPKYRLQSAVREVQSRLNYARYKAIFEGVKVRVRFDASGYTIEKYTEEQKEWKREKKYSLQGVRLQANNSPVFHPSGTVSNLASITVSNSSGTYRITLAISGRIKTMKI